MWYAGLTLVFISSGQNINTQIICWCPHWLSVLQILFEGRFFLNHQSSIYAARFHVFSFWIEESFNLDHQLLQNLLLQHPLYFHLYMKCLDNDHRQVCISDHFCGKYILQKCNLWCNHIKWLWAVQAGQVEDLSIQGSILNQWASNPMILPANCNEDFFIDKFVDTLCNCEILKQLW